MVRIMVRVTVRHRVKVVVRVRVTVRVRDVSPLSLVAEYKLDLVIGSLGHWLIAQALGHCVIGSSPVKIVAEYKLGQFRVPLRIR